MSIEIWISFFHTLNISQASATCPAFWWTRQIRFLLSWMVFLGIPGRRNIYPPTHDNKKTWVQDLIQMLIFWNLSQAFKPPRASVSLWLERQRLPGRYQLSIRDYDFQSFKKWSHAVVRCLSHPPASAFLLSRAGRLRLQRSILITLQALPHWC